MAVEQICLHLLTPWLLKSLQETEETSPFMPGPHMQSSSTVTCCLHGFLLQLRWQAVLERHLIFTEQGMVALPQTS